MTRPSKIAAVSMPLRQVSDAPGSDEELGTEGGCFGDQARRADPDRAKDRLRALIEEGIASGPGLPRTRADDNELLSVARGHID